MEMADVGASIGRVKVGNCYVEAAEVFTLADRRDNNLFTTHLGGKVVATLFLTESVRTRTTFERAAIELGANIINVFKRRHGEPLKDFGFALTQVADIIVARLDHDDKLGDFCSDIMGNAKVVNAGCDGLHPTQALVDVYTMLKDGLEPESRIAWCGPRGNRALESFIHTAEPIYQLKEWYADMSQSSYDALYCVTMGNGVTIPTNLRCVPIYHPFPRGCVVPHSYDWTSADRYHNQMKNAVRVRRAILQCVAS